MMKFINGMLEDKLILSADDLHVIKWYFDSSVAVHPDFKSHTGAGMTYGTGMPNTKSQKQKLNTCSSTEAELVGTDDVSSCSGTKDGASQWVPMGVVGEQLSVTLDHGRRFIA